MDTRAAGQELESLFPVIDQLVAEQYPKAFRESWARGWATLSEALEDGRFTEKERFRLLDLLTGRLARLHAENPELRVPYESLPARNFDGLERGGPLPGVKSDRLTRGAVREMRRLERGIRLCEAVGQIRKVCFAKRYVQIRLPVREAPLDSPKGPEGLRPGGGVVRPPLPVRLGRKKGQQVNAAKLRELRGTLSQPEFAEKCGVSVDTIQRGEAGGRWSANTFPVVADTASMLLGCRIRPEDLKNRKN